MGKTVYEMSPDGGTTKYDIRDTNIAPVELDVTSASQAYAVGESFVLDSDGKLYTATSPISQNDDFIVYPTSGYNCKLSDSVTEQIGAIKDSLGTASSKNSTSVVTDSTDLVESGAVKDIVGWGNANIADNHINTSTVLAGVTLVLNSDKTITLSGTSTSTGSRNCCEFLGSYLKSKGNTLYVSGGVANKAYIALRNDGFSYAKVSRGDVAAVDTSELLDDATYYITIGIEASGIDETGVVIKPMLSKEGGSYEPYHSSIEETLRDGQVVEGKNKSTQDKINNVAWAQHINVESIKTLYNDLKSANSAVIFSCDMKITTILETADSYIYGVKLAKNGSITADYASFISSITTGQTVHYQITIPLNDLNNSDDLYLYSFGTGNTGLKAYSNWEKLFICDAAESDLTYEPYYVPLKDVVPTKTENSVIAPVENNTTASQAYAVGSHAIRNGAFITWKNAKAQGEAINDVSDYDSGDVADILTPKYQSITKNGLDISAGKYGKFVIITISNGTCTDPVSANDSLVNLSDFSGLFSANDKFLIPFDALDTYGKTLRIWGAFNESSVKVRNNVSAGTAIRVTIVALLM